MSISMLTRRAMLRRSALGFGSLALSALQRGEDLSAQLLPMEKRRQLHHFAPRAKSVIMLLQSGGVSQMDVLDPKPELTRRHG